MVSKESLVFPHHYSCRYKLHCAEKVIFSKIIKGLTLFADIWIVGFYFSQIILYSKPFAADCYEMVEKS